MERLARLVLILVIGAVAGWPITPRVIGPAASRGNEIPPAVVENHGHLTVLRLRGTPYEMGYQHGVAQRAAIRRWVNEEVYGRTILGGRRSHGILLAHARQLEDALPKEIRRELRGIADGAGLSYEDVLLLNLVLNHLLSPPSTLASALPAPPTLNLQALGFAAVRLRPSAAPVLSMAEGLRTGAHDEAWPPATRQDDALDNTFLGYRLDAPGWAEQLRRHLLAVIYRPTGEQAYATLTWSGQVGAWCGLNEASLAICATPAKGGDAGNQELPPAILTRQLLAHARDGEQALRQAILHHYIAAFQLLIADGQRQSAMAIVFSAHRWEKVEPQAGTLTFGPDQVQMVSLLDRNLGWLNRDKALAMLATHQPLDGGLPGMCSESTLLNALFVPSRSELWVGLDLWPASCRRYLRLGLDR